MDFCLMFGISQVTESIERIYRTSSYEARITMSIRADLLPDKTQLLILGLSQLPHPETKTVVYPPDQETESCRCGKVGTHANNR